MRPLGLDKRAQRGGIRHVDHVRAMRDLVAGRVRIAVDRDHLDAEPLQRDDDFLAEFAGAEQHDARGRGRKRRTEPLTDLHVISRFWLEVENDCDVNTRIGADSTGRDAPRTISRLHGRLA